MNFILKIISSIEIDVNHQLIGLEPYVFKHHN